MDKLTTFPINQEVTLASSENNSIDTLIETLDSLKRQLMLLRKGHEEWTWGEQVENSEIDLEEIDAEVLANE